MKYLALALFSTFGAFSVYWAVASLSRGEYLTALAALAFGISWFAAVAMGARTTFGKPTARTEYDAMGTTIRPDRAVDQLSRMMLAAGTLAAALFAVLAPMGLLAISIPKVQRFALPAVAAIMGVTGAVMLWRTIRQGSLSYLRLTPSGFEFGGGLSTKRGEWSTVKTVTDMQPGRRNLASSAIIVEMSDRTVCTMASTGSYTADENELRDMVQFYWHHPEARSELTDGAALNRLRSGVFHEA